MDIFNTCLNWGVGGRGVGWCWGLVLGQICMTHRNNHTYFLQVKSKFGSLIGLDMFNAN